MLLKKNGMLQDGLVDILKIIIIKCLFKSIIKFQKKKHDINTFCFVRNLLERNDFGDDSSISNHIKCVKES